MLASKDQEQACIDDQAADSVREDTRKVAMHRIVKKVPSLTLLAATVVASVDPGSFGGIPGHLS